MQEFGFVADDDERYFGTQLHATCGLNASLDVVLFWVEVGREALGREENKYDSNFLLFACKFNASIDVVSLLVKVVRIVTMLVLFFT
mmetsp:Transcript_6571/g.9978  ORF Transcript_6571/g.9978 Transcript_6571/m.9978 type:complete len:87 (-) Transcript_6571:105-365(-)